MLDDRERQKFIEHCRAMAFSADAIARQFDTLVAPVYAEMSKREKQKATAYSIVAMDLERCESFSISKDNEVSNKPS